jgi:hypothetical protein
MMEESDFASRERFEDLVQLMNKNKVTKSNCFDWKISTIVEVFRQLNDRTTWGEKSGYLKMISELHGLRIDKLYADVFSARGATNQIEAFSSDSEDDHPLVLQVKGRQARRGIRTLVDSKDLRYDQLSKQSKRQDAYFKMQSGLFRDNAATGMMLCNLRISSNLALVLESQDLIEEPPQVLPAQCFIGQALFNIAELESKHLCYEMSEFENAILGQPAAAEVEYEQIPTAGLEVSDDSDADFQAVQDEPELESVVEPPRSTYDLLDTIRDFQLKDDYIYHNLPNPRDWAGFGFYDRQRPVLKDVSHKKRRKHGKKEATKVNLANISNLDVSQLCPVTSKEVRMPELVIQDWRYKNYLPKDYRVRFENLTRMFSRPQTQIKLRRDESSSVLVDSMPQDFPGEDQELNWMYAQPGTDEVPEEVRRKEAKSWRQSKYIDMKKVKKKVTKLATSKKSFTEIVDCLPDELDETERARMSLHLCFVTLLHLAEKKGRH